MREERVRKKEEKNDGEKTMTTQALATAFSLAFRALSRSPSPLPHDLLTLPKQSHRRPRPSWRRSGSWNDSQRGTGALEDGRGRRRWWPAEDGERGSSLAEEAKQDGEKKTRPLSFTHLPPPFNPTQLTSTSTSTTAADDKCSRQRLRRQRRAGLPRRLCDVSFAFLSFLFPFCFLLLLSPTKKNEINHHHHNDNKTTATRSSPQRRTPPSARPRPEPLLMLPLPQLLLRGRPPAAAAEATTATTTPLLATAQARPPPLPRPPPPQPQPQPPPQPPRNGSSAPPAPSGAASPTRSATRTLRTTGPASATAGTPRTPPAPSRRS